MSIVRLYGIPNCDTVKKAIHWLEENKLPFEFHDYKKDGVPKDKLKQWCDSKGWETLFNRRSTTWKELSALENKDVKTQSAAITTMLQHSSIIKRPVIEFNNEIIVGYNEKEYFQKLK
jgi:Spx/MgsR family transcriptional regulator